MKDTEGTTQRDLKWSLPGSLLRKLSGTSRHKRNIEKKQNTNMKRKDLMGFHQMDTVYAANEQSDLESAGALLAAGWLFKYFLCC